MDSHKKKKKARSRWYCAETIKDADYGDDLVLLANTPSQAKYLLHSLELAARSIDLYENSDKTEFICFQEYRAISLLNSKPQKLVD